MIRELKARASNQYAGTLRARPNQWVANQWRKTYRFGPNGNGLCSRNKDYTQGRFSNPAHSKDGYLVSDCKNLRYRRVLEFLVSILLPDKSTRVTIEVASTIIACFEGRRFVDWRVIFYNTVKRMVSGIGGTKPSSLSPFLFHLYKAAECLDAEEEAYYKSIRVAEAYGLEDSEESTEERAEESGTEGESGPSEPARQNMSPLNRQRQRGRQRRGQPKAPGR